MNEAETRLELIDPKLKEAGWGIVEGSKLRLEYPINRGEIKVGGIRASQLKADYILDMAKFAVEKVKGAEKAVERIDSEYEKLVEILNFS